MLMGEYIHSMDSKGRLIIPAKWKSLEKKLKSLPLTKKDARAFVRFFFSGATECQLDKQGRISIPTNLRDHGQLEKEIVIIGVSNRVELWSKDNWDEYLVEAEDSYEDIAETIEELGI
jgi:MraZ protein